MSFASSPPFLKILESRGSEQGVATCVLHLSWCTYYLSNQVIASPDVSPDSFLRSPVLCIYLPHGGKVKLAASWRSGLSSVGTGNIHCPDHMEHHILPRNSHMATSIFLEMFWNLTFCLHVYLFMHHIYAVSRQTR